MSAPACEHPDFTVLATVVRLLDTKRFVAEVEARCALCGVRFRWLGLPMGLSMTEPMVSVDEFTLRAPIQPDAHLTSWMAEVAAATPRPDGGAPRSLGDL